MIVIATPTGSIGRQVLARVLERDAPVRVIARDPSRLAPEAAGRVEVVRGSLTDEAVVTEACAGADAVFWLVPPNPRATGIATHTVDCVRTLCAAIGRQDVPPRVVGVSSLGRGVARNAGQISAIFAMDDLIESTGVHYRSLCPPGFMDNMLWQAGPIRDHGAFYASLPADRRTPACATRDIAAVAAGLLLDDSWTGQGSVPLLGPEDLSQEDMAKIMSDVLDRPIRYQRVSAADTKASLVEHGMTEAWAQGLVDMTAAVERGIYDLDPGTPRSATPTTFRRWCEHTLKPAVEAA